MEVSNTARYILASVFGLIALIFTGAFLYSISGFCDDWGCIAGIFLFVIIGIPAVITALAFARSWKAAKILGSILSIAFGAISFWLAEGTMWILLFETIAFILLWTSIRVGNQINATIESEHENHDDIDEMKRRIIHKIMKQTAFLAIFLSLGIIVIYFIRWFADKNIPVDYFNLTNTLIIIIASIFAYTIFSKQQNGATIIKILSIPFFIGGGLLLLALILEGIHMDLPTVAERIVFSNTGLCIAGIPIGILLYVFARSPYCISYFKQDNK